MFHIKYITIDSSNDQLKLEKFILKNYKDFNYIYIQKLIRNGQIRVNKKRVKLGTTLYCGDILRLPIKSKLHLIENKPSQDSPKLLTNKQKLLVNVLANQILYQDEHILAINKPAGLATQGGKGIKTSIDKLLPYIMSGSKIVHRLDKQTSGVLLLAKTNAGAKHLFTQFKEHKVCKTYRCIVKGKVEREEGVINANILKNNNMNNKCLINEAGKKSITFYRVLDVSRKKFLLKNINTEDYISYLEVSPQTGRTHQIRIHLAKILNTPIVGDIKYGYSHLILPFVLEKDELFLHAYNIKLKNLDNKEVIITASLGDKWEKSLKKLFE